MARAPRRGRCRRERPRGGVRRGDEHSGAEHDGAARADARGGGDTAYLLASGQGKARSDRAGGLRAPTRFRVLFLSTGELSLADKIAEGGPGRRVKAGQEVRLVDIPADARKGLGLFEDLHGAPDAETFIQALRAGTSSAYGTAAVAFLEYLVSAVAADSDFAEDNRDWMKKLVEIWVRPHPDAGGQVLSVARRFALIAVAGERATQAGITGWEHGVATAASLACFNDWLTERGTPGAREDAQAVAQLRDFLTRHGDSRFQEWREPGHDESQSSAQRAGNDEDPSAPPASERFRTVGRAGWRRRRSNSMGDPDAWHYYLTADGMNEALAGLDRRRAMEELVRRAFIQPGSNNKLARSVSPPGHPKIRLYHVLPEILSADDHV